LSGGADRGLFWGVALGGGEAVGGSGSDPENRDQKWRHPAQHRWLRIIEGGSAPLYAGMRVDEKVVILADGGRGPARPSSSSPAKGAIQYPEKAAWSETPRCTG
jgi:hypothetical protein